MADITIDHSGDGTLVYGTSRGDAPVLTGAGFRWSRRLGAWFLPRTWRLPTRDARVQELVLALGDRAVVKLGAAAKSSTAEEREQAKVESLERSVDRHERRGTRQAASAQAHSDRADQISGGIPSGQPILVGHHSEGRHRRDLARIHASTAKGAEAHRAAAEEQRLADSARAQLRTGESAPVRLRRIARNEAELRRIDRQLLGGGKAIYGHDRPLAAGPQRDRLEARRRELEQNIEYDRAKGEPAYGPHNVQPGDVVTIRGRRHVVDRTNAKTFRVAGPAGMDNRGTYAEITAVHRPAGAPD